MTQNFDYMIVGGGCAGLSLAYRMSKHSYFKSKSILLVEPQEKNQNDRTWSYWSRDQKFYNDWAVKNWGELVFKGVDKNIDLEIDPYKFYTIRGIDFYNQTLPQINSCAQITQVKKKVTSVSFSEDLVELTTDDGTKYTGGFCFDSRIDSKLNLEDSNFVWQHFKGWDVVSEENYFDDNKAVFMDFSIDQQGDTRFFYICLLYTSPSPRDQRGSRMPSSA